ncbi:MAG: helix-turn-helix domain-containing protein [Tardiphaga sp.]
MPANNECRIPPASELATWGAKAQATGGLRRYVQYDAVTASTDLTKLCGLPVVDLTTGPVSSVTRIRPDTAGGGVKYFKMLFQMSGCSTVSQNERTSRLGAGDLGIIDATRPVHVSSDKEGCLIGLHLPRQQLIAHLGFEPQGGLCWKGESTLAGRLLTQLVRDTIADDEVASESAQDFLRLAIYNLVGALFSASELPQHVSPRDKLFLRVCHIIKRDFSNPDVGPAEVAAEAGISVRYVQKIFAMRGATHGKYLKSLRLDHAAYLLDRRTGSRAHTPLVEIAWACGYRDYAHFARNFRSRFGHTPGSFNTRP